MGVDIVVMFPLILLTKMASMVRLPVVLCVNRRL
jgi:hypothetical protein